MTSGNAQQKTHTCRTAREDYVHVSVYLTLQWNPLRWRPCKCAVRVHRCGDRLLSRYILKGWFDQVMP